MKIIKRTNTNATTYKQNRRIDYIVIHYTAGTSSKAGQARNTASYFSHAQASADFIVDDAEIVQYNPDLRNYYCWAVGGSKLNHYGVLHGKATNANVISIEMCSNNKTGKITYANDANFYLTDATVKNTIELTNYLMAEFGIPDANVIRHFDVTGKSCPGVIGWNELSGNVSKWKLFKQSIKEEEEEMTQEQFNVMMNNYLAELSKTPATWGQQYLDWAVQNGIFVGDENGNLMPNKFLTRLEAAALMERLYELVK